MRIFRLYPKFTLQEIGLGKSNLYFNCLLGILWNMLKFENHCISMRGSLNIKEDCLTTVQQGKWADQIVSECLPPAVLQLPSPVLDRHLVENAPPGSHSAAPLGLFFENLGSYSEYLSVVYILQLASAHKLHNWVQIA